MWRFRPQRPRSILLVSTKNVDLLAGPTPEDRDSRTFPQIWQICTKRILCVCSEIRSGQRSLFLVLLTKRSLASGDEKRETGNNVRLEGSLKWWRDSAPRPVGYLQKGVQQITKGTPTRTSPKKDLISRTTAVHVRCNSLYISLPSSAKQRVERIWKNVNRNG